MNYLICFIEILYMAMGGLELLVAPRLGPNPYIGFRVGYTLSDEEVWKKSNVLMGEFMLVHSLFLIPFCFYSVPMVYFLIFLLVPMLLFIPVGIKYAAELLETKSRGESAGRGEAMKPITLGIPWLISPAIFYAILLLYMSLTYSQLPEVIAVHFDSSGSPNGWATRNSFVFTYALYALILPGIAYLFAYLGYRYPMYVHPGRTRFPRDAYLKTLFIAMDLALVFLLFVYYTIYLYATQFIVLGIGYTLIFTVIIVLVPIGYLVSKWRR